jgi:hypothetical protein
MHGDLLSWSAQPSTEDPLERVRERNCELESRIESYPRLPGNGSEMCCSAGSEESTVSGTGDATWLSVLWLFPTGTQVDPDCWRRLR